MLLMIHFLYTVVDVSAQHDSGGDCTVTVVRPSTLTNTGGVLPSGSSDVRFQCSCTRSDDSARPTRWYGTSGAVLRTSSTNNAPYLIQNTNTNATLVIPTFTMSYAGIYTCGGNFASDPLPPTATVNLTISKLIISAISYVYLCSTVFTRGY